MLEVVFLFIANFVDKEHSGPWQIHFLDFTNLFYFVVVQRFEIKALSLQIRHSTI
jgi:hypothetical protein